jgi:galactokinase
MKKADLIQKTLAAHAEKFGTAATTCAWAPGRIEVLGNHTDYNEGTVLSAAIDLGICFCISRSEQTDIRALAVDLKQDAQFGVNDTERVAGADWANYIKGTLHYVQEQLGTPITGLNCTFAGSIPQGAGLSSSAALEVATSFAVLHTLNKTIAPKEIAILCRKAEHKFAGTNCGLLDQFSSIFGREHGLIHSDFRSLDVSGVDLAKDIEFLVVDPKVKHTLSDSPYNERRERCEQAAIQLNELLPHPVKALRDVSAEEFEAFKDQIDPGAAKRAAHVVGEITRVALGVDALANNDLTAFGELLYASHQTSIDCFENSCPELDIVVQAARDAGALGARLSGGGFGGCAIVMVHAKNVKSIGQKIVELCQKSGITPDLIEVVPSAGAEIIG